MVGALKSLGLGSVIDTQNEKLNAGGTHSMHPELKTNPINQTVLNFSCQSDYSVAKVKYTVIKDSPVEAHSECHLRS